MKRTGLRMTALLLAAALLWLCLPAGALAAADYLIADSDSRKLTASELWEWNYESLGYVLNEIFARHGYVFERGGKYDLYFSSKWWYVPNSNPNNDEACYPQLNSVEWYNENLIKQVRSDMKSRGTTNPSGRSIWDEQPQPTGRPAAVTSRPSVRLDVLSNFYPVTLAAGQSLPVYAAPSSRSWRGANGKAAVGTTGNVIYTCGWDGSWLMILYQASAGYGRVGYIDGRAVQGDIAEDRDLSPAWSRIPATVVKACDVTDDPAGWRQSNLRLPEGAEVLYLAAFANGAGSWDYIETTLDGKTFRGFIPAGCLVLQTEGDEWNG